MRRARQRFSFLRGRQRKIIFVGDKIPAAYEHCERVILGTRALLPAFADTHIHFMSYAMLSGGLDIRETATIPDILARIDDFTRSKKDRLIIGFGASAHSIAETRSLRCRRI